MAIGRTRETVASSLPSSPTFAALGDRVIDPNLKNAWAWRILPGASPFWIADNATGLSTLYDGAGNIVNLVVTIPLSAEAGQGSSCPHTAAATGMVWKPLVSVSRPEYFQLGGLVQVDEAWVGLQTRQYQWQQQTASIGAGAPLWRCRAASVASCRRETAHPVPDVEKKRLALLLAVVPDIDTGFDLLIDDPVRCRLADLVELSRIDRLATGAVHIEPGELG